MGFNTELKNCCLQKLKDSRLRKFTKFAVKPRKCINIPITLLLLVISKATQPFKSVFISLLKKCTYTKINEE